MNNLRQWFTDPIMLREADAISRHEQLLYRLDKIDEALLALSQSNMLIIEMLNAKKQATKRKSAVKEGEE